MFAEGGTLFAFGNGGSATDATDVVADFRAAPQGWAARKAIDLTADSAILTALANYIGTDVLFGRQIIAYAKKATRRSQRRNERRLGEHHRSAHRSAATRSLDDRVRRL